MHMLAIKIDMIFNYIFYLDVILPVIILVILNRIYADDRAYGRK